MQVEEFKLTVNVEGLSLLPIGVLIAWDWEWNPTDIDSSEKRRLKGILTHTWSQSHQTVKRAII